jgi:predicted unusual protein kinase regulating ubiquinone biosynthesis (AarF/ABC1/UbiB family)
MHADIHPGNIFIDVKALRNRKKGALSEAKKYLGHRESNKIFTLIDTGNVINLDKEQAMRAINLTSYIKYGNTQDIAEYMLYGVEGAALGGHTKEEAVKILKDELNKIFFDYETKLQTMTNESLVEMASNIMRKHGITPVDTQLSLNKARQSANNSLEELYKSMSYFYIRDFIEKGGSKADLMNMLLKVTKDVGLLQVKYSQMQSVQEKLNLKHLSLEQRLKHKKNPNMLKTNSEEYLTYHLKQKMRSSGYNSPAE